MKPFDQQNYYELLEVHDTASDDEIRAAYDRAIKLFNPESVALYGLVDASPVDALRARLLEAMEILTDADLREEYNKSIGIVVRPKQINHKEPTQLAMIDLLAAADSIHSGRAGLQISYTAKLSRPRPSMEATPESNSSAENLETSNHPTSPKRLASPPLPLAGAGREGGNAHRNLEIAADISHEAAIATAEANMAQVAARVREVRPEPRAKPLDLPPDAEFNGELLRQCRENRGIGLQQLGDKTRISGRHLENIEADRYGELPATVYLRGFLVSIARELALDPQRVSRSYLALVEAKKAK